jgi:hypothetical protein
MDIDDYETITGTTVAAGDITRVTATIAKVQRILETMLGYTLDPELVEENEYVEIGKSATACPCPDVNMETLEDPDAVVGAYRMYSYNRNDQYLAIDPATDIHAVKLVKDGVTLKTLDTDEYRAHLKQGIIKFLERCETCTWCLCQEDCYCAQLAVDADYMVPGADFDDVWTDMVTFYSDPKKDVQSERLGSHSYTKYFDSSKSQPISLPRPEMQPQNLAIITKYSGPNGSVHRTIVI